jgi:hypothetical protein
VTGREEYVDVYTTLARPGELLYVIAVSPRDERGYYDRAFQNMVQSLEIE